LHEFQNQIQGLLNNFKGSHLRYSRTALTDSSIFISTSTQVLFTFDDFNVMYDYQSLTWTRNSSGDEIANVNFLYDIVHVLQNTIDSCINSATYRHGYVLERMCLPNSVK